MLVTTVVAGGIAILQPFLAASRPFLRDVAFYMTAVFLTFTALYLGRVTLAWALGEQRAAPGRGRAGPWAGGWLEPTGLRGPSDRRGRAEGCPERPPSPVPS